MKFFSDNKSTIFFTLLALITLGYDFYSILSVSNLTDLRTFFGHFLFYQTQTIIYFLGLTSLYVVCSGKFNLKILIKIYIISYAFILFGGNILFHQFLDSNNLYIKETQTNEPFFLHAVGVFAFISLIFSLGYILFAKRDFTRIIVVFFTLSFYIFFYSAHIYLGRTAYLQYLNHYEKQMMAVLSITNPSENMCEQLNYQCFNVTEDEIPHIEIDSKNKINKNSDASKEVVSVYKHFRTEFEKSGANEKVYLTESFARTDLRAMNFGFKKTEQGYFVLISSATFAYALDLYMFYLFFLSVVFFIVWGYIFIKLMKFHSKIKFINIESQQK